MTAVISYASLVSALGGECSQVMVYGFADCKYETIAKILRTDRPFGGGLEENPIKRVFDYKIADFTSKYVVCDLINEPIKSCTLEGWEIYRIKSDTSAPQVFKAALVNIIIENVKRQRIGLPLIPVLFTTAISSDTSGRYPPSIEDVIQKRAVLTFRELRRVYKLCADPAVPEEVRLVAERTFKFVKVLVLSSSLADSTSYAFELIKAPWQTDLERWQTASKAYSEMKKGNPPVPFDEIALREKRENGWYWIPQILEAIKERE